MEEVIQRTPRSYYLKGKWRHWFWPLMVYSPLISAIQILFIGFYIFKMPVWELIIINTVTTTGWVIFLLIYGLKNNVKEYRSAFIALAAFQFAGLALGALTSVFPALSSILSYPLIYSGSSKNSSFTHVSLVSIPEMAFYAGTTVLYFLFVFNKRTNVFLRIAAIISAAVGFAYCLEPYISFLLSITGDPLNHTSTMIISVLGYLGWASTGLFYGAMSFSKPKNTDQPQGGNVVDAEPKWTPPPPEQPMENEPE